MNWRIRSFRAGMQIEWVWPAADDGVLRVIACRFSSRWVIWLALMLQQVTCLLSLCVQACMCELMQSKIVRNTGITGRSSLSDEIDARLLLRRSNHTHILRLRWRGWTPKGATASLMMHRCTCVKVSVHMHAACTSKHAHTQTAVMHSSSQTVQILLGCAPISRINEELSHFTVKQRVGLWGKNGCHLQFLKSAFNNVINFKVMR